MNTHHHDGHITIRHFGLALGLIFVLVATLSSLPAAAQVPADADFHDSHFHISNFVQEGTDIHDLVAMMGTTIGRSTVFGLPLQQMWSYGNSGDFAPTYYLQSDAPLYYYSFTDAHIAMAYRSLTPEQQLRFDPMIIGFNPADMYAADHIRRVLLTFPGVFSGIGEFSIHKEFVSAKVAGDVASLTNPALDRIFDFAAEVGLVVILHNDINMPFPKPDQEPYMLAQLKALFARHPDTTIIWAHIGLGRVVRPLEQQAAIVEKICTDPALSHVYMDISWDEVAKYATATPEATRRTADMLNRYPDRFLFGTDVVAPASVDARWRSTTAYAPLWAAADAGGESTRCARATTRRCSTRPGVKVRAWEQAHADDPHVVPPWTPVSGTPAGATN